LKKQQYLQQRDKPTIHTLLNMELNFNNFDNYSKKIAKELSQEGEKFKNLINKLQVARVSVDESAELEKSPKEEIKK
jgi:hypothetical protein